MGGINQKAACTFIAKVQAAFLRLSHRYSELKLQ